MNIDKDIERCKELIKTEHSNWIGMSNQKSIENVLTELETYKKVAEKLAYYTKDTKKLITDCVGWGCTKGIECTECIIDWARKEVEKDE